MRAWIDGTLLDDVTAPAVSVLDHGFTVGDGVFESVKVVDGRPFALTRHLRRLADSARGLGLPLPEERRLRDAVDAVLGEEHLALGRLRLTVTGGAAPVGSARGDGPATVAVVAAPLSPSGATVDVVTVPWPRNERGAIAGLKTTSYAENVVALAYARDHGAGEAVFGNLAGNVCEGTGSNVFYGVDGELRTPTLRSGCLAGITRALLVEWCDVREVDERLSVLATADEIFLASTTRDVQAVRRCDRRELEAPGPLTRRAAETWRQREAEDPDP
jgi:branched-chain amino acid aminotransferase